jgi:transaldolase
VNVEHPALVERTRALAVEGFEPHYDERADEFPSDPLWARAGELGSELWLDSGDLDAVRGQWTREFRALTTNNTLLNKEVQKGTYDDLVAKAAEELRGAVPGIDDATLVREIAFVLNARHGLRLVETFDAFVSVEEHTDLAHDVEAAVGYARRYHAICPRRFFVKIPLTAEGLLAARRLAAEDVPVNLTLGFSARQNALVTAFARPAFCNVFLGRLNQVVAVNDLGDGALVGERATVASQRAVAALRDPFDAATRQIAASIRSGEQVRDLLGVDVLTIPPAAADEFRRLGLDPADLERTTERQYEPRWAEGVDPEVAGLAGLWDVPDGAEDALHKLVNADHAEARPLLGHLAELGLGAALPAWSEANVERAAAVGKIPALADWRGRLESGEIGLDALMNLHGLRSFAADQEAMDDRIRGLI